jgi:hypothetical protein
MKEQSGDIQVHVKTPTVSELVGTIRAFDIQPPVGQETGNLGGVEVKFAWRYGRVISVQVSAREEADILIASLGRK